MLSSFARGSHGRLGGMRGLGAVSRATGCGCAAEGGSCSSSSSPPRAPVYGGSDYTSATGYASGGSATGGGSYTSSATGGGAYADEQKYLEPIASPMSAPLAQQSYTGGQAQELPRSRYLAEWINDGGLLGLRGVTREVTFSSRALALWPRATLSQRRALKDQAAWEDIQATVPARYVRPLAQPRRLGSHQGTGQSVLDYGKRSSIPGSTTYGLGDTLMSEADPSVATGILPDEPPADLGPSGWPLPAGFRPGNWEGGRPTEGKNRYQLAFGDTLSGLSTTYLGGPQRWREIWEAGSNRDVYSSPDKLPAGGWIDMPREATDAAVALMKDPNAPRKPASPGAPGSVPGAHDPADDAPGSTWSTGKKVAAAVGGLALIGGLIYAAR